MRFIPFPRFLTVIILHLDCMGDLCSYFPGPRLSKVRIKGGVGIIINPPFDHIVQLSIFLA